jgi:hypothetical protein
MLDSFLGHADWQVTPIAFVRDADLVAGKVDPSLIIIDGAWKADL